MDFVVKDLLIIAVAFLMFGVIHSLTAGRKFKRTLAEKFGERFVDGWYRLLYNLISVLTLLPAMVIIFLLPDKQFYAVSPSLSLVMRVGQVVGVGGVIVSLFMIDLLRFIGLRQVIAYLRGDALPLPDESLQIKGLYRFSRHPLYFFSLLMLWSTPVMSVNLFVLYVAFSLYFVIGSRIEEKRLVRDFGEAYRKYQQEVSWLMPFPPRSKKKTL